MLINNNEKKDNNVDKYEVLDNLLDSLPDELKKIWKQKIGDPVAEEDIDKAIITIENVLSKRKEAKETLFTSISEIKDEELKEEVRTAVQQVEKSFGNPSLFVGNGSVAEVYYLPQAPHVCVKYLVNPDKAKEHGNNFREESEHLHNMRGFVVEDIRVPDLFFYHMSNFGTCFGMEKIEGKSINLITENPECIDYLSILQGQDMKDVLRRMKNFISKMHSEKKLVHRDLTARNIMVDKNGKWYVIDFGRAKQIEIGDPSTEVSENADYGSAEGAIRALFAKIKPKQM